MNGRVTESVNVVCEREREKEKKREKEKNEK